VPGEFASFLVSELSKLSQLRQESNQQYFQRMLWVPLALAFGCAAYFSLPSEPKVLTLLSLLLLPAGALLFVKRLKAEMRALPEFLILLIFTLILGMCYSAFRSHTMATNTIPAPVERVMIEGWIQEASGSNGRERFTIRVQAADGISNEHMPDIVRLSQRANPDLYPGRFVRCFASIRPPPEPILRGDYNFARNAYFDGLGGVGFVFGSCEPGRNFRAASVKDGLLEGVNASRRALAESIATIDSRGSGLTAALLTGDRSFLSEGDQSNLRQSGLAHLLAISGIHLGLAAGVFYFALYRIFSLIRPLALRLPVQKLAAIGALIAVTAYLIFSGASISTQRAYVMVASVICYSMFDRPLLSFQSLALAMLIVIVIAPWSVLTPGFQMSFAATAALLAAYRPSDRKRDLPKTFLRRRIYPFISSLIVTSVVAGLATMPFALFHFGRAAPLGFIANLVAMPIISLICVPLAAISVVLLPIGLAQPFLKMLSDALGVVLEVADYFAREQDLFQHLNYPQMSWAALVLLTLGLIVWTIWSRRGLLASVLVTIAGLMLWSTQHRPEVIVDDRGHVFARIENSWTEIRVGGTGLRPIGFSDIERLECRSGCEFKLRDGLALLVDEQAEAISLVTEQAIESFPIHVAHPYTLSFGNDQVQRHFQRRDECRLWSTQYPQCGD
tara:strand:- start:74711 stop:76732 length:2022 start_codon:yes stop_codon:yes gene_type:complete